MWKVRQGPSVQGPTGDAPCAGLAAGGVEHDPACASVGSAPGGAGASGAGWPDRQGYRIGTRTVTWLVVALWGGRAARKSNTD